METRHSEHQGCLPGCHGHGFEFYTFDRPLLACIVLRVDIVYRTEGNKDMMSTLRKVKTEYDLSTVGSQFECQGGDLSLLVQSSLGKLTCECDEGTVKPGQEGDAASKNSLVGSANVSSLIRGYEALASRSHRDRGVAPSHALPDDDRVPISLRPSVRKIRAELEQLTEQTDSVPSASGVVTGTPPPKPPRLHRGDNTDKTTDNTPAPPPKPARCKDFVLYRNRLGQFEFLLLATEVPEKPFGASEETLRCKIHVVCQAAGSIGPLPVGRLVAMNFLPVHDKTTSELYDILNRSAESVRLKIQPLDFPLAALQGLMSEQEIPSEEETQENGDSQPQVHPVKKLAKRRLWGAASVLSRCRKALRSCWR
ncbi:Unconventional myosin-XVIIIa [Branchiostoma belcheri]|nr:Unconventional myosin-XVIIIa [Branchiostoma belcheri]